MSVDQIILPVGVTVKDSYGDHYRIEALLGKGSFGAVYRARNRQIPQNVFALKEVIDPNPHDRERLLSECEILKHLDHRALPHVYHAFSNPNLKRIYLLMEYVEGKNLEELRRKQPSQRFPVELALAILAPIVDALIYMHNQVPSIIHRDIKPANIIMPLNGEEAVLVDFGAAKEYVADFATRGFSQGSPGFAAIEQYGTGGTDIRTDVYGLAATFYTLVSGVTPVAAISRLLNDKRSDLLKPLKVLMPTFPADVSDIIEHALSINKADRYATVEEFWQALLTAPAEERVIDPLATPLVRRLSSLSSRGDDDTILNEDEQVAVTTAPPAKTFRPLPRIRPIALALCLFVLVTAATFFGFSRLSSHPIHMMQSSTTYTTVVAIPTSNVASNTSLLPTLAASYSGTISDINIAQEKTVMTLTEVQTKQGKISGVFNGLGQVGHFSGTLTSAGAIQFNVSIQQGASSLAFTGTIKVGGDLAGDFYVLNQNGQRTGEYGIWNVSAAQ